MATSTAQLLRLWWRRGGRDRVLATFGFAVLVLTLFLTFGTLFHAGPEPAFDGLSEGPVLVDLTLVHDAEKKGAECLSIVSTDSACGPSVLERTIPSFSSEASVSGKRSCVISYQEDLQMLNSLQALLTGCSAGGLATFIHCDNFRALLPKQTIVKCLPDAGFFIDANDISGKRTLRSFYHDVVHLQDLAKDLSKDCISKYEPAQCFFPQDFIKYIRTPLFILNPAYDAWQVQHVLAPSTSDPQERWQRCRLNIHNCDTKHLEALQETIGDWYFDRREAKEIECPYICTSQTEEKKPEGNLGVPVYPVTNPREETGREPDDRVYNQRIATGGKPVEKVVELNGSMGGRGHNYRGGVNRGGPILGKDRGLMYGKHQSLTPKWSERDNVGKYNSGENKIESSQVTTRGRGSHAGRGRSGRGSHAGRGRGGSGNRCNLTRSDLGSGEDSEEDERETSEEELDMEGYDGLLTSMDEDARIKDMEGREKQSGNNQPSLELALIDSHVAIVNRVTGALGRPPERIEKDSEMIEIDEPPDPDDPMGNNDGVPARVDHKTKRQPNEDVQAIKKGRGDYLQIEYYP
ncbi:hypothetical protein J5N97_014914 [Dioscorea zingiberensis]|uniref:Pectin acetylesterase n=1 Tax=Dioscorea zingiberensis TaxID=325984 RepID=A0A9D5HJZ0_9LILI|nr:hypothetical protein J5N97_014914 [Dioscorea zingiberensis]